LHGAAGEQQEAHSHKEIDKEQTSNDRSPDHDPPFSSKDPAQEERDRYFGERDIENVKSVICQNNLCRAVSE
jgi:hypothetical protein